MAARGCGKGIKSQWGCKAVLRGERGAEKREPRVSGGAEGVLRGC